jgi:acetylglutamate kinase
MADDNWLQGHRGDTVVVKFGGNAMVDDALKRDFAADVVALLRAGIRPVVVHGGGPQISAALQRAGIPTEFRGGYRFTSTEAIQVVHDVLADEVSGELTALINAHGDYATAVSGEHESLFSGRRRGVVVDGQEVDLGHVGDIDEVNPAPIVALLDAGRIPVISSIAPDSAHPGHSLNVNADAAASAVAIALRASWLLVLTDVAGLYRDWPNRNSLVTRIDTLELQALLPTVTSGMIPKVLACLDAVRGGVGHAAIVDGTKSHALVRQPFGVGGTTVEPAAS